MRISGVAQRSVVLPRSKKWYEKLAEKREPKWYELKPKNPQPKWYEKRRESL